VPPPLAPLSSDPAAGRRLGLHAVTTRAGEGRESAAWVRAYEQRFDAGSVNGRLYVVDGVPAGFVSWFPSGPVGVSVELLYLDRPTHGADPYAKLLAELESEAGPVAFVPGPLAGLSAEAEERLMRSLGFRRYARSEMVLERREPLAEPPAAPGETLRKVERADLPRLAELHRTAYRNRFDRYLFLELADEAEDAVREVREILDGRWGEFLPEGSFVSERGSELVGAVLSVHGTTGALVADVMVSPAAQGLGVGRRVLARALRSMHDAGVARVYLNVTEGNERAIRLYRGLGFVRSMGPTRDWYNARRIPVPPSPDA
jgi:ribosomal protein S18 acetylase RimI-like enzyme